MAEINEFTKKAVAAYVGEGAEILALKEWNLIGDFLYNIAVKFPETTIYFEICLVGGLQKELSLEEIGDRIKEKREHLGEIDSNTDIEGLFEFTADALGIKYPGSPLKSYYNPKWMEARKTLKTHIEKLVGSHKGKPDMISVYSQCLEGFDEELQKRTKKEM